MADGIKQDFKIVDIHTQFNDVNMHNYKSATNSSIKPLVEQSILDEIRQGNYVLMATKPTVLSALGAIPKPKSTRAQLINDCSRHALACIMHSLKVQSLDDAITLLGTNYCTAKIDLKCAYHSVPIHPANYQATGSKWSCMGENFDTFMILASSLRLKAHRKYSIL